MSTSNETRRIVITGATRGLGRALAEGFAAQGHTVIGCGRDADKAAELGRSLGPPHRFDAVDVSDGKAVAAWAGDVVDQHGVPDIVIANAALANSLAPFWQIDAEEFDRLIDVNIKGVAHVVRAFLPAMVARRSGVVIGLSSYWGRSVAKDEAPYCCSKWGIEGLMRALALDLPEGMAAVPLNPGVIDTDMLRSIFGAQSAKYPSAETWALKAVPYILEIDPKDNGKPLTVPN